MPPHFVLLCEEQRVYLPDKLTTFLESLHVEIGVVASQMSELALHFFSPRVRLAPVVI